MKANTTGVFKERQWFAGILFIIFFSRLPFLLPGFGSEEDAWGLFVTAKNISQSGQYEVSRLPGHPFQEIVYSWIWQHGAFAFNLLTALLGTASVAFFMLVLKKLKFENFLVAGITFAFVPVVYINSANAMDYMWAMAFVLASFYFLLNNFFIAAGILLGLATGCRITSAAMIVPFIFWMADFKDKNSSMKNILKLVLSCVVVSLAVFSPVLIRYGINFFDYVAQVPASFIQAVFRCTIGVWGVIGFTDLLTVLLLIFVFRSKKFTRAKPGLHENIKLIRLCLIVIIIYFISFILLPQKAAFFIPMIPFIIILLQLYLNKTALTAFSFSMIFSSFFIGINLNDELRGTSPTSLSMDFTFAGQNLTIDFLRGPVMADHVRRQNKMEFADKVVHSILIRQKDSLNSGKRTALIAGFWWNDLAARMDSIPPNFKLIYYVPEESLMKFRHEGYEIFYLPEQEKFNDRCFKKEFTKKYSQPFFSNPTTQ